MTAASAVRQGEPAFAASSSRPPPSSRTAASKWSAVTSMAGTFWPKARRTSSTAWGPSSPLLRCRSAMIICGALRQSPHFLYRFRRRKSRRRRRSPSAQQLDHRFSTAGSFSISEHFRAADAAVAIGAQGRNARPAAAALRRSAAAARKTSSRARYWRPARPDGRARGRSGGRWPARGRIPSGPACRLLALELLKHRLAPVLGNAGPGVAHLHQHIAARARPPTSTPPRRV